VAYLKAGRTPAMLWAHPLWYHALVTLLRWHSVTSLHPLRPHRFALVAQALGVLEVVQSLPIYTALYRHLLAGLHDFVVLLNLGGLDAHSGRTCMLHRAFLPGSSGCVKWGFSLLRQPTQPSRHVARTVL
jgi:hypothetical protein